MAGSERSPGASGPRGTRGRPGEVQAIPWPGVLLVSGTRVVKAAGGTVQALKAPRPGPADEMLDRLSSAVGNNGLVLIGGESPSWEGLVTDAGAWKVSGGDTWFTASRGATRLRLALLDEISPDNDPLLGPDELATVTRHARFAGLAGVPFYADGGATGALLMEETVKVGRGASVLRAWRDEKAPRLVEAPWLGPWGEAPEGAVQLDKNAYYLCAANSALLPADGLAHTEARPDPRAHVGLWLIRIPDNPEKRLPHPLGLARQISAGTWRWVASPTLDLLADLGVRVEIGDSWTCPRDRCRRLLSPWYERLRAARAGALTYNDHDALAVQQAVKDTYSRGIGCLDRSSRRWHRPDWRAIIYAQARANFYRALLKAGRADDRWPAQTRTDAVLYVGDPPGSFRLGGGLGEWKVTR